MNPDDSYHDLTAALRLELQEYGGLIALFEEQQSMILRGDPDGFLYLGEAVNDQIALLAEHRARRNELVQLLAERSQRPRTAALSEVLGGCPTGLRGTVSALMDEINSLITRTQRRMRQNQMLLARCISAAQQAFGVNGGNVVSTYSSRGCVNRVVAGGMPHTAVA
jgi:flagellar biosynthesis/type III secretory pathway chaperone